jgi:hypothetical protein
MLLPQLLADCCEPAQNSRDSKSFLLKSDLPPLFREFVIRHDHLTISGSRSNYLTELSIASLVIENAEVTLNNVHIKGRITVVSGATLHCENCVFEPFSEENESTIAVCDEGQAILNQCRFVNSNQCSIAFKRKSHGHLIHCRFEGSQHSSVLVIHQSTVVIRSTEFANAPRFAVYYFDGSRGVIEGCQFGPQAGKGVFITNNCVCSVLSSRFEGQLEGGIGASEGSRLSVVDCDFSNLMRTAIHGTRNCVIQVDRSRFKKCGGNGVNFEYTTGIVKNSEFSEHGYPVIAVFGDLSTPVIMDCVISHCKGMGIVARDGCAPTFTNVKIDGVGLNGFSISDFSRPRIVGCTLSNIKREPFSIFNGARPTLIGNHVSCDCENAFCLMTRGVPWFRRNVFIDATGFRLDRHGALSSVQFANNFIIRDGVPSQIVLCGTRFDSGATEPENSRGTIQNAIEGQTSPGEFRSRPCDSERHRGHCLRCHRQPATRMCSPCGHLVVCEECSVEIRMAKRSSAYEVCPLCATPVSEAVEVFEETLCVVCLSSKADTTILPCGHKCVCYADAKRMSSYNRVCPICRARITTFKFHFPVFSQRDEDELNGGGKNQSEMESGAAHFDGTPRHHAPTDHCHQELPCSLDQVIALKPREPVQVVRE